MNLEPARMPGESFWHYKVRRKANRIRLKRYMQGKVLHASIRIVSGAEIISDWMATHQRATREEIEAIYALYHPKGLYKVRLQGTYIKKIHGKIGSQSVWGRKRIVPSNRPKAVAAREDRE